MLFILQSCHKERWGKLKEETAICASYHSKEGTTVLKKHPIINFSCEFSIFNNTLSLFIGASCLILHFCIFIILVVSAIHGCRYENLTEYPWESDEDDKPKECWEIAEVRVENSSDSWASHETHSWKCFSKTDKFFAVLRKLQWNKGKASCLHEGIANTLNETECYVGIKIPPVIVNEFSWSYSKLS